MLNELYKLVFKEDPPKLSKKEKALMVLTAGAFTFFKSYYLIFQVAKANKELGVPMKYESGYVWHSLTVVSSGEGTPAPLDEQFMENETTVESGWFHGISQRPSSTGPS